MFFPPPENVTKKFLVFSFVRDFRNAISASVRISEIGVRSSWEASAVNCDTPEKCTLDSGKHLVPKYRIISDSSPVFNRCNRLLRFVPDMFRAVA